jgi:hypothetical protein
MKNNYGHKCFTGLFGSNFLVVNPLPLKYIEYILLFCYLQDYIGQAEKENVEGKEC